MIDLLSPVGDFDCLKAAVQNGANSVYFGANLFSARAYASNFDLATLEKAIIYAKTRGVKTNLTLNTLITDDEFSSAIQLAQKAYEFGIDAIIVQDLGLAKELIRRFPNLAIHASTQMTIHNLQGVLEMQELGFKRVVLARELSLQEIEYICKNSDIEIECFVHGALCISYSGQCLFSSMIGGRSGNRGKCAQPCRLPYKLLEVPENNDSANYLNFTIANNNLKQFNNNSGKIIDGGYLLSPRDLCGLDLIPDLINAGVDCLKIEGRMKNPEYVATVTRIYRKYIDLAEKINAKNSNVNSTNSEISSTSILDIKNIENQSQEYIVDESDKKALLQAFNRGMFSHGHLENTPNKDFICKEKSNNMGLFLGKVEKYNKQKGYITVKLQESIEIGDTVALEKEKGTYNVSELMQKNKNIKETKIGDLVTIGRMKGNINLGDKIYKMSSKKLNDIASESIKYENRKIPLNAVITIKENTPIKINITFDENNNNLNLENQNNNIINKKSNYLEAYNGLNITYTADAIPQPAKSIPLNKEKILEQINKTNDTIFEFKNVDIELDNNLFLPISSLNNLRRNALDMAYNYAVSNVKRNITNNYSLNVEKSIINNNTYKNLSQNNNLKNSEKSLKSNKLNNNAKFKKQISVLLNILNTEFDYSKLSGFYNVYIPLKYFTQKQYSKIIKELQNKFKVYIYMPTIIKANYRNLFYNNIENTIKDYNISGFVISNISNLKLLEKFINANTNIKQNQDIIKKSNVNENNPTKNNEINNKKYEIISNYTFNVLNLHTAQELQKLGINKITISPESTKNIIENLTNANYTPNSKELLTNQEITTSYSNNSMNSAYCKTELIVYGNTPLMNMNYCPLGKTNKCYPTCEQKCLSKNKYYLTDRLNMNFRILFDNIQTVSTIYNCKTTSISANDYNIDCARIDILDENIEEINSIVATVKGSKRFEGKDFTNGNLNKEI